MDTFFTTFVENWATFYSFIWSHWLHAIHSIVCQLPKRPILMTIWTCLFLEKNENWRLKSRDVSVCSLELNSFLNEFNLLSKWNWKIPEHKFCNKSSENFWYNKIIEKVGCRHSSVDSSVPSILPPFGLESQAHHFCFYELCLVENTKINKKRPRLAHLKNKIIEKDHLPWSVKLKNVFSS